MFDIGKKNQQTVRRNQRVEKLQQKKHKVYILQYSPSRSKSNSKGRQHGQNRSKRTISQRLKTDINHHPPTKIQPSLQIKQGQQINHLRNIDKLFNIIKNSRKGTGQQQSTGCQKVVKAINKIIKKKGIDDQINNKQYAFQAIKQYYFTISSANYQLFIKSKHDKNFDALIHSYLPSQPTLQKIHEEEHSNNSRDKLAKSDGKSKSIKKSSRQIEPNNNLQSSSPIRPQKEIYTPNSFDTEKNSQDDYIRTYQTLPKNDQGDNLLKNIIIVNDQIIKKRQSGIQSWTKIDLASKSPTLPQKNTSSNNIPQPLNTQQPKQASPSLTNIPSSQRLHASIRQLTNNPIKPPSKISIETPINYKAKLQQFKQFNTRDNHNYDYQKQKNEQKKINPTLITSSTFKMIGKQINHSQINQVDGNQFISSKKQFFVFDNIQPEIYITTNIQPLNTKPTSPTPKINNNPNPAFNLPITPSNQTRNSKPTSPKPKLKIATYAIPQQISKQNSRLLDSEIDNTQIIKVDMNEVQNKKKLFLKDVIRQDKDDGQDRRKIKKNNKSKVINSKQIAQMMLYGNSVEQSHHYKQQVQSNHYKQQVQSNKNILILDETQYQPKTMPKTTSIAHPIKSQYQLPSPNPKPSHTSHQYFNEQMVNPQNIPPAPQQPQNIQMKRSMQGQILRKRCNSMPKITFTYYPSHQKYQQAVNTLKRISPTKQQILNKQINSSKESLKNDTFKLNLKNPHIKPSLKQMYEDYKKQEQNQSTLNSTNQAKKMKSVTKQLNSPKKTSYQYKSPNKQVKTTQVMMIKQPEYIISQNRNKHFQVRTHHEQPKTNSMHQNTIIPHQSTNHQYYSDARYVAKDMMMMSPKGIDVNKQRLMSLHDNAKQIEYVGKQSSIGECCMTSNRIIRSHSANDKLVYSKYIFK